MLKPVNLKRQWSVRAILYSVYVFITSYIEIKKCSHVWWAQMFKIDDTEVVKMLMPQAKWFRYSLSKSAFLPLSTSLSPLESGAAIPTV